MDYQLARTIVHPALTWSPSYMVPNVESQVSYQTYHLYIELSTLACQTDVLTTIQSWVCLHLVCWILGHSTHDVITGHQLPVVELSRAVSTVMYLQCPLLTRDDITCRGHWWHWWIHKLRHCKSHVCIGQWCWGNAVRYRGIRCDGHSVRIERLKYTTQQYTAWSLTIKI